MVMIKMNGFFTIFDVIKFYNKRLEKNYQKLPTFRIIVPIQKMLSQTLHTLAMPCRQIKKIDVTTQPFPKSVIASSPNFGLPRCTLRGTSAAAPKNMIG
jgi:hypothetical protein